MLNSYGLQAIVDVPARIGPTSQTAIDQIIYINKNVNVTLFAVNVTVRNRLSPKLLHRLF
jgi:hypothetical protein